jgi:hypothetical protein
VSLSVLRASCSSRSSKLLGIRLISEVREQKTNTLLRSLGHSPARRLGARFSVCFQIPRGGQRLLIPLLSAEPVTLLRFVINNRLQVAGCDSPEPRHMRQGDQFRLVIPPACGNFVQIDL